MNTEYASRVLFTFFLITYKDDMNIKKKDDKRIVSMRCQLQSEMETLVIIKINKMSFY